MDMIAIDDARALVADSALWPRIRDFLWNFVPQIHPSWLEDLEVEAAKGVFQTLKQSGSQTFKRFVLASLGVEPCFHAFPKDDWSRLVLLDGATLESIVKWLGAIACAAELRRVTDGKSVRELKASLPGVYPEVFTYTAYFSGFDLAAGNAEESNAAVRVETAGLTLLHSLLGACPAALVRRLKLKLPKGFCGICGEGKEQFSANDAVKKLLKLRFPEAYSLCC